MMTEPSGETDISPSQAGVWFHRRELNRILNLYGRMVAAGEWRDYAIDGLRDRAVFSVYRRASEHPLYTIEKHPALARRQGAYAVVATGGQILKRGRDLAQVLRVFDRKLLKLVAP
ncbi:MAG: DUF2794 domain-containing protein [Caulobacterales bacterium]|nr:DUF2794 domain-containing protein [Caulobacterales bacterium]